MALPELVSPTEFLDAALNSWLSRPAPPQRTLTAQVSAIHQDFNVLLQKAPHDVGNVFPDQSCHKQQIMQFVSATIDFIHAALRKTRSLHATHGITVTSPIAGGQDLRRAQVTDSVTGPDRRRELLRVGSLNPGNAGFCSLRSSGGNFGTLLIESDGPGRPDEAVIVVVDFSGISSRLGVLVDAFKKCVCKLLTIILFSLCFLLFPPLPHWLLYNFWPGFVMTTMTTSLSVVFVSYIILVETVLISMIFLNVQYPD